MQPVDATIHVLIPEFEQALARDPAGYQYALVPSTPGVPWNAAARRPSASVAQPASGPRRARRARLSPQPSTTKNGPLGGRRT